MPASASTPPEEPPLRVLCVDDEPFLLAALQRVLRHRLNLVVAESAVAALSILRTDAAFDAIVTDFSMPGTDGIGLLTRVADDHPRIVRILLSGRCCHALQAAGLRPGIVDRCIDKPFPPLELPGLIAHAVHARHAGQAVT